jgi:hypothetical protein
VLSGGFLRFSAGGPGFGHELWQLDPGASVQQVGAGCSVGIWPMLHSTDPVLGAVMQVSGEGAASGQSGALLLGLPVPALRLGGGCYLYLHAATAQVLAPFAPVAGSWSLPVPVPAVPALAGLRFGLQALLAPSAAPLGFDLTNAVVGTLGS